VFIYIAEFFVLCHPLCVMCRVGVFISKSMNGVEMSMPHSITEIFKFSHMSAASVCGTPSLGARYTWLCAAHLFSVFSRHFYRNSKILW
jgi:hypothetical protein